MQAYYKIAIRLGILLILLCGEGLAQRRIDLSITPADMEIAGRDTVKKTGHALAIGDVNGDTIKDLIIGAPGLDSESRPTAGRVYVIFGSSVFSDFIDLNTASADLEIQGDQAHGGLGTAVSSADINGDGIDDMIIGEPGADGDAGEKTGAAFVFFGRSAFPDTLNIVNADVRISGEAALNEFGDAITTGDVDNNGVLDLVFGVNLANPPGRSNAGKVVVIYGRADLPAKIDLAKTRPNLQIFGPVQNERMGNAVASADINNDGWDDLIIGNFKANATGGVDAGKTFVIFGNDTLAPVFDLAIFSPHITISGSKTRDHLGFAVAAGDFNGDGLTDLFVGARRADAGTTSDAGQAFIFLNRVTGWPKKIDLTTDTPDFTISGAPESTNLGYALAIGNINGDNHDDLAVGARFSSPDSRTQSGESHVFFGRPSANGATELPSSESDLNILGAAPENTLGNAVALGDLNADGRDEMIVAAEDALPAGRVYVFFGDKITDVENMQAGTGIPERFHLHQNYPNPFNAGTTIRLEIPNNAGTFFVSIYNIQGQLITHLFEGTAPAGQLQLRWDGTDTAGRAVASGVYVYALNSGEAFVMRRKLILLK